MIFRMETSPFRRIRLLVTVMVCALPAGSTAQNVMSPPPATSGSRFLSAALDFQALLPAPPPAGTLAAGVDLEAVQQAQAWRTAEQVAWAQVVAKDDVFNHARIVGSWFNPEKAPRTAAFFKDLAVDVAAVDVASKEPFLRPRPSKLDPTIDPCVPLPKSTSYPSGSAMQAFVWAELLADLLPAKREALLARAHRAAWGRVIGGVHFPSDVVAGRILATAFLAECRKNAAFRAALADCRREVTSLAASGQ
ncbi:MAG: hypothetical protein RIQ93_435 [Verrucomicrobiota bacterium]|jgi:acid phosphatase (class A)